MSSRVFLRRIPTGWRSAMSRPSAPDLAERIAGLTPEQRAYMEQRLRERGAEVLRTESIPRRADCGTAPLSFAQQRLWFLDQLKPGIAAYNLPLARRLRGALDVAALEKSVTEVLRRHDALRTVFPVRDGQPVQAINPPRPVALPPVDLSGLPEAERQTAASRLALMEAATPFDLSQGPLFRARLLRLSAEDHVVLLTMHHIVSDGWSLGILQSELAALYGAFGRGERPPLPELPIQYADYALWQREHLSGELLRRQSAYWERQLAGAPAFLPLPTDRPRPPSQTFRGASAFCELPSTLLAGLKAVAQGERATLFMTLLAAFQVLLARYTGQEDIVVGSPIAGRTEVETERLIGFFVNTLVLRTDLSGDPTFRELLQRVREVALGAYAHQDLPFEKLVEELKPERDLSQNPLFQVSFALENASASPFELAGLEVTPLPIESRTTHFDLEVYVWQKPGGLTCTFVYATDLFDSGTIVRMMGHYQTLLEAIVTDANRRVSELAILTEAERRQVVEEWNQTGTEYPRETTVHDLFEEQAERTPEAEAVVFERERLTYSQLNERANRLAGYLSKRGVGPEVLVGLCVERSLEMVVGLLGILKAGGAYVPLDPAYPKERLAFMLEDTGTQVVLTQKSLRESLPEGQFERVRLDADWPEIARESAENPKSLARADNLAYVIYTSGSTGEPKGVRIAHRSLVNHGLGIRDHFELAPGDRVLQFSSFGFDVAAEEIFPTLASGAALVLRSDVGLDSFRDFGEFLRTRCVTVANLPSSYWHEWVSYLSSSGGALPPTLRLIVVGSEAVSPQRLSDWRRLAGGRVRWLNAYGLSETTITSTLYELPVETDGPGREELEVDSVPIGRPIANTRVFILDHWCQPVPIGVPGELYIGGDGLARDYYRRPKLTAQRFLPNPFGGEGDGRLYRTGDRARFQADGTIDFLGRFDDQVKIGGFRIEPDEVQAVLAAHPGVRESVVGAREDSAGERRLVAYVIPARDVLLSSHALRGWLKKQLPDYMVPSVFVMMKSFPLMPNGKVDRQALPAPALRARAGFVAPRNDLERQLAAIWEQTLSVKPIGIRDNFFDLGGHSLLAAKLVARIERAVGRSLPLAVLFDAPTIGRLGDLLREERWVPSWSSLVPIRRQGSKVPLFCVHGVGGNVMGFRDLATHLSPDQPVYGIQAVGLDGRQAPLTRVEDMARHYIEEIRVVQPQGPYHLAGASFGGTVAFEIARQLRVAGSEVGLVALIDTFATERRGTVGQSLKAYGKRMWFHLGNLLLHPGRLSYIRKKSKTLKRRIRSQLWRIAFHSPQIRSHRLPGTLQDVEESCYLAIRRYVPAPYSGRVTLFRAQKRSVADSPEVDLGWGSLAGGGVEIYEVPGDHGSMLGKPHVAILAGKIQACLDRRETDRLREPGEPRLAGRFS
jgi:amino acid adenylation domain-containing protein